MADKKKRSNICRGINTNGLMCVGGVSRAGEGLMAASQGRLRALRDVAGGNELFQIAAAPSVTLSWLIVENAITSRQPPPT